MKTLFKLLILLMTVSVGYGQTLTHGAKVRLGDTPLETTGTNAILVTDATGIISDSGLTISDVSASTGLEALNEGNGIGWRLIGRDPADYGNIGLGAIDFSYSTGPSSVFGARGNYNFVTGTDNDVEGDTNTAFGTQHVFNAGTYNAGNLAGGFNGTVEPWNFVTWQYGYLNVTGTPGSTGGGNPVAWHSGTSGYSNNLYGGRGTHLFGSGLIGGSAFTTIVGAANVDLTSSTANQNWAPSNTKLNPAFIVGVGDIDSSTPTSPSFTRENGFVVWRNGTGEYPTATIAEIDARGSKAALTLEYMDATVHKHRLVIDGVSLRTLNTTPIELVAAPGAGTTLIITSPIVLEYDYGTVTYDAINLSIQYSGGTTWSVNGTPQLGGGSSYLTTFQNYVSVNPEENASLELTASADSVALGDGTLVVHFTTMTITNN